MNDTDGGWRECDCTDAVACRVGTCRPAAPAAEADEDCGHHSWAGLMALLDEHWPKDIFPTREDGEGRDAGARIVSLLRRVDEQAAEAARLRETVARVEALAVDLYAKPLPNMSFAAHLIRGALDGTDV